MVARRMGRGHTEAQRTATSSQRELVAPSATYGFRTRSGGGSGFLLREAFAAEDGATLGGAERDGGLLAALRTGGSSFDASVMVSVTRRRRGGENGHPLGLAGFAALGLVLELFVVEKQLFPGGKNEVGAAVDAGEYFVLKFH